MSRTFLLLFKKLEGSVKHVRRQIFFNNVAAQPVWGYVPIIKRKIQKQNKKEKKYP